MNISFYHPVPSSLSNHLARADVPPPGARMHQHYTDQNQSGDNPIHNPARAEPLVKTQPRAYRQSDDPVAREMTEHGGTRIARAAQRSRRHHLQSIEELKKRRHTQQSPPAATIRGFRREQSRDRVRDQPTAPPPRTTSPLRPTPAPSIPRAPRLPDRRARSRFPPAPPQPS